MKNHYLITQIADIIIQIFENGLTEINILKKSIKEISSKLLDSFCRHILTDEDISHTKKRIQIRLL
jgi:ArsR family metal-binding transcriptional regulator